MTSAVTSTEKTQVASPTITKEAARGELQGREITTKSDSAVKVQEVAKEVVKDAASKTSEKPKEPAVKPQEIELVTLQQPSTEKQTLDLLAKCKNDVGALDTADKVAFDKLAPQVESLTLENGGDVKSLATLFPNLREISIKQPQDAASIRLLKPCNNLRTVTVAVKDEAALVALGELANITTVNVRWGAEAHIENFPKISALTSLTINGQLKDKALKGIAQNTSIRTLSLNPENRELQKFTNGGMRDLLKALTALTELRFAVTGKEFSKVAAAAAVTAYKAKDVGGKVLDCINPMRLFGKKEAPKKTEDAKAKLAQIESETFSFKVLDLLREENLPLKTITFDVPHLDGGILGGWLALAKRLRNIEHIQVATADEKSNPNTPELIQAGISSAVALFVANKNEFAHLRRFTLINPQDPDEHCAPFLEIELENHLSRAKDTFTAQKKACDIFGEAAVEGGLRSIGYATPKECDIDLLKIDELFTRAEKNIPECTHIVQAYSRA